MKRLLFVLVLLLPEVARAGTDGCECSDLRKLERELWEQEFVYRAFREYANGEKSPNDLKTKKGDNDVEWMTNDVTAALGAWMRSPAGGGKKGNPGAALGTTPDCDLVVYVGKKKTAPLTPEKEQSYRKGFKCQAIPDYLLTHERKHVENCKDARFDRGSWKEFAGDDVTAYHAGIADLRKSISELASDCGWKGSVNPTKQLPGGREVPTIPTADEIKNLAKALRGKK